MEYYDKNEAMDDIPSRLDRIEEALRIVSERMRITHLDGEAVFAKCERLEEKMDTLLQKEGLLEIAKLGRESGQATKELLMAKECLCSSDVLHCPVHNGDSMAEIENARG